jgi:hypothetical protein
MRESHPVAQQAQVPPQWQRRWIVGTAPPVVEAGSLIHRAVANSAYEGPRCIDLSAAGFPPDSTGAAFSSNDTLFFFDASILLACKSIRLCIAKNRRALRGIEC